MTVRLVALTPAGRALAERLRRHWPAATLWYRPQPFSERVRTAFRQGDALVLVTATGIAVRTLAPVLASKHEDPPVLVLDEAGRFVIPLLSGHEGGANDWGRQVAEQLGAELVLTTARPYLSPVYTLGLGCERGCPAEALRELIDACLEQAGLELDAVHSLNSIDLKADEDGLLDLARTLARPFRTWSVPQLRSVEAGLSTRSDYVFETVGVYGVAESAALYAAHAETDSDAELVVAKLKNARATCALARSYPPEPEDNTP